jgi:hypothetical protein
VWASFRAELHILEEFKSSPPAVPPSWKRVVGAIRIAGEEGFTCIPKKRKKSKPTIENGTSAIKKANEYFPTIEFYRSVNKIPRFNGLFIYCLQLRARRGGGGLERKQRNGGPGVHQKIFSGFLIPDKAKLCTAGKR